ncbi:hypothetical protein EBR66_04150 [bacterium]|nr:hypothetical protein [bacterium]
MKLNPHDEALINNLKDGSYGALMPIEPDQLPDREAYCAIVCGDGVRRKETTSHLRSITGCNCDHTIALPGGASLLAPESPLSDEATRKVLLEKGVAQARKLQGTKTVLVTAHLPCGAAYDAGITGVQLIDHIVSAKHQIRLFAAQHNISDITPVGLLDVEFSDGKKRTYVIKREGWEAWKQENATRQIAAE